MHFACHSRHSEFEQRHGLFARDHERIFHRTLKSVWPPDARSRSGPATGHRTRTPGLSAKMPLRGHDGQTCTTTLKDICRNRNEVRAPNIMEVRHQVATVPSHGIQDPPSVIGVVSLPVSPLLSPKCQSHPCLWCGVQSRPTHLVRQMRKWCTPELRLCGLNPPCDRRLGCLST